MTNAFVSGMTWAELAAGLARGAVAIMPVGAGAKQHGLHMPMATDQIQAEWFAGQLAKKIDALIWPALTYGYYPAFTAYPGSVSLTASTFEALVLEIAEGLIEFGARRIVILNSGLSTIAPIDRALCRVTEPSRVRHLRIYDGPRFRDAVARVAEQTYGSHADEIETSIMLAIAPGHVDMAKGQDSPPPRSGGPVDGPLSRTDITSPNYSASGSFGMPTLASREKGLILTAAILADLEAAFATPDT